MSPSSGQQEAEFVVDRACDAADDEGDECKFEGQVDAWFDPEISVSEFGWTCPNCKTEHREETTWSACS